MADKETDFKITIGAEADEKSAEQAAKQVVKKVNSSVKGGRIDLPVDISVDIDKNKDKLTKAQAAVVKKIEKMTAEGFSASGKDIDDLVGKFETLAKELDKAGKGRQNKIFREIRKQVEEIQRAYQLSKDATKPTKVTKTNSTGNKKRKSKTDSSPDFSAKENQIDAKHKLKQIRSDKNYGLKQAEPKSYPASGIDPGRTSDHMMRLSDYSTHGSKWADELARILQEEIAKSAKTLVKWIEPNYKVGTRTGDEQNPIDQNNQHPETTERQFLTDTINNVKKELKNSIKQLEAGSEEITLDTLKEQAAVIKVLTKALGKTAEDAETKITDAIEGVYTSKTEAKTFKGTKTTQRKIGGTSAEEGSERGVGPGHERTQKLVAELYKVMKKWDPEIIADRIAKEVALETDKTYKKYENKKKSTKNQAEEYKSKTKDSDNYKAELEKLNTNITKSDADIKSAMDKQLTQDKVEGASERVADTIQENEQKATTEANKEEAAGIQADTTTGFNTDAKADTLIDAVKDNKETDFPVEKLKEALATASINVTPKNIIPSSVTTGDNTSAFTELKNICKDALTQLTQHVKNIDINTGNLLQGIISMGAKLPTNLPALIEGETVKDVPQKKEATVEKADYDKFHNQNLEKEIEKERNTKIVTEAVSKYRALRQEQQEMYEKLFGEGGVINSWDVGKSGQNSIPTSKEITSPFQYNDSKILDVIRKAFGADSTRKNAKEISSMTLEEQQKLRASRIEKFGLNRGANPNDTGDIAQTYRTKKNYGWGKNIPNPFENLTISDGIDVDTTAITEALQNSIQKNMFKAQTGGTFRNLIGSMTGYIGMPSLEKSRAEADAANQIMANVRDTIQDILNDIKTKETDLKGLQDSGKAVFENGKLVQDNSKNGAATKLFADLEDQKESLRGVLADASMIEEVVKATGGNLTKIIQQLGFAAPELRKNNKIIENINAGLDKSGKALKFQSRTGEVLNYSFQLLARSIGQIWKNWMAMLNPINLIKKAFNDFSSYDMKWQRTMNVIKYNIRRIIKPFMEWLVQQFVNIIGLVNALMKGLGKAFGKNWDLFDQSAASAEQMREELEAASNVTAGFDELHDIGGESSSPPGDLMGDIYTPQWDSIYQNIEAFGKKIGDVLAGIKKFTEGWNFWTWLAVIGGALIGLKVLKWLIDLFGNGKNPLKPVADGLSFLEKAVGWALLIWAFTEFTKALTGFVECMKTASWKDISKALIMLGSAFALLVAGIAGVGGVMALLKATPKDMLGMSAIVFAFDGFVKAIVPFIECIRDLGDKKVEVIVASLLTLVGAFIVLIGGVAGVEGVTKGIGLMGNELFGLASVVGALDLFVAALVPFIKAISEIEGDKWDTIIPMIGGLVGAFIALAAGVGIVSRAFSTMDWKAVGQLYVVAGVFEVFMYTLIPFLNAIKDVPFETLTGGTILIAGAFLALGGAIALMAPALAMLSWSSLFEGLFLMAALAGMIWVLGEFVKNLQGLTSEQMISGLLLLAGALMAITVAIGVLAAVFTAVATTGIGVVALALLALILGVVAGIILAIADLVRAMGEAGDGIKLICEGIAQVIDSIGNIIVSIVTIIGEVIISVVDTVTGAVVDLAVTIAREVGETIRSIIETVGNIIKEIIDSIINAIPKLLQAIVNFCHDIGPAIENSVEAIIRSITKLVNFVVSAVEYICNLVIGAVNKFSIQVPDWIPGIGGSNFGFNLQPIEIPRFVPKYEKGTNYVPNDGLAYLHQGEAVVPKKYNTPYQQQGLSPEEKAYMEQMMRTLDKLDTTMNQGIDVKGQFVQRGSDLIATVEKANNRMKNNVLNNKVYAR